MSLGEEGVCATWEDSGEYEKITSSKVDDVAERIERILPKQMTFFFI